MAFARIGPISTLTVLLYCLIVDSTNATSSTKGIYFHDSIILGLERQITILVAICMYVQKLAVIKYVANYHICANDMKKMPIVFLCNLIGDCTSTTAIHIF